MNTRNARSEDEDYVTRRNALIPRAAAAADRTVGAVVRTGVLTNEQADAWNRVYFAEMDRLWAEESGKWDNKQQRAEHELIALFARWRSRGISPGKILAAYWEGPSKRWNLPPGEITVTPLVP